jgi:hypothetical protein
VKFSGQPKHEKVNVEIKYRDVFQDAELVDVFVKAVTMLALAVGAARIKDTSEDSEARRWAREFLIGYGLLTIGEARSILLLFSDGLNVHARIHFRALFEYQHKITLLLEDEKRVIAFRDSLAFELRAFAKRLGKTPEDIEAEIGRILGIEDPSSVVGTKESTALGGDVKSQMRDDLLPEKRYLGTFAWTSQVNHGSILALYELSKTTSGKQEDVLLHAALDNKSNDLLYDALWVVFQFIVLIEQELSIGVPGVDGLIQRALKVNERMKFSTPEHEAEVQRLREEKRKRNASK